MSLYSHHSGRKETLMRIDDIVYRVEADGSIRGFIGDGGGAMRVISVDDLKPVRMAKNVAEIMGTSLYEAFLPEPGNLSVTMELKKLEDLHDELEAHEARIQDAYARYKQAVRNRLDSGFPDKAAAKEERVDSLEALSALQNEHRDLLNQVKARAGRVIEGRGGLPKLYRARKALMETPPDRIMLAANTIAGDQEQSVSDAGNGAEDALFAAKKARDVKPKPKAAEPAEKTGMLSPAAEAMRWALQRYNGEDINHILSLAGNGEGVDPDAARLADYVRKTRDELINAGIFNGETEAAAFAAEWLSRESNLVHPKYMRSGKNAIGPHQVRLSTAKLYNATEQQLQESAWVSAWTAVQYLSDLMRVARGKSVSGVGDWREKLDGKVIVDNDIMKFALAAYNHGPENVGKLIGERAGKNKGNIIHYALIESGLPGPEKGDTAGYVRAIISRK